MGEQVNELNVTANGFTFGGLASGPAEGRPVVLLHGFPETSWSWRNQLVGLADAGYRAVALDQRGYSSGARPTDVAAYQIDKLVHDVFEVAEALGMADFDLVGHDWGGMVAWVAAAQYPDLLRSVTVLSTPHPAAFAAALSEPGGEQQNRSSYISFFRQEGIAENALLGDDNSGEGLKSLFAASGFETDDSKIFVDAMREPGALTAALNWYRANIGDDMTTGLADTGPVTIPTMYIWSTEDIALGREAAEATREHVTGPYRFEVLEGVSHWVPEMAPDAVNGLLIDFLGSQPARN
ncbi:MAG: alpha/beta hydrolase [Acidimicrobiales bacterium]